mgnify:CR=1 FL=1
MPRKDKQWRLDMIEDIKMWIWENQYWLIGAGCKLSVALDAFKRDSDEAHQAATVRMMGEAYRELEETEEDLRWIPGDRKLPRKEYLDAKEWDVVDHRIMRNKDKIHQKMTPETAIRLFNIRCQPEQLVTVAKKFKIEFR